MIKEFFQKEKTFWQTFTMAREKNASVVMTLREKYSEKGGLRGGEGLHLMFQFLNFVFLPLFFFLRAPDPEEAIAHLMSKLKALPWQIAAVMAGEIFSN